MIVVNAISLANIFLYPYVLFHFPKECHAIGALFDINGPENNSPNNSGQKKLPAPVKAMIWYPYRLSQEFPDLGEGGRTAIAGTFYHYNKSLAKKNSIPGYYDNSLLVMDWMRNWIFAIRFDENENYKRMEAFMPLTGDFRRPIDKIGRAHV